MSFFSVTNYYNNLKGYLPQIPSIPSGALRVFSKCCPTKETARDILRITYVGTSAIWFASRGQVTGNELIFNTSLFSILSTGLCSIYIKDGIYFETASIISNLTGLFFQTVSPWDVIWLYLPTYATFQLVRSSKSSEFSYTTNITNEKSNSSEFSYTTNTTNEKSNSSESVLKFGDFFTFSRESGKNKEATLYLPRIDSNAQKSFVDLCPQLLDYLNQKCCIQKKAREELAKQIAFHYENIRNSSLLTKKHIALHGPKHCRMVPIIYAIAEKLGIPILEIFSDTSREDIKKKLKDLNQDYIWLEHLDENSFHEGLVREETQNLFYSPSRALNIFISNRKITAIDEKKQLMPDLPKNLRDACNEVIQFTSLTKEDHKALLYKKKNPESFYALQEELKKTNRLLNVDEIPAAIVEKCLQRIIKSNDPHEPRKVMKDLLSFILYQTPHENGKASIPMAVQLNSLPDNFNEAELTMTGMKAVLDERIVGQDAAKQAIIEAIFFHQQSVNQEDSVKLLKGNVLLIGPSEGVAELNEFGNSSNHRSGHPQINHAFARSS